MYIDEGESASLEAIGKSMEAFVGAAAAGQFAVNQHGGDAMLAAIRKMADWIADNRGRWFVLTQEPKLGSSNAAKVMKPYVQQVAVDPEGFLTQLDALAKSLSQAEAAIKQAMDNYREVDENAASRLT
ncbi:hypothetical protein UO65_6169 [Actinokineospora spheciospongiae]|uniref:Uncharacterized protein n=1 Tax=Actinokineospora spheciospongiae TaxID=909613 RepID=W7IDI3_9PSEU|nr:hypothetical protein [Actinokineospora spheciospongiae]EWC58568.1 hypothetical protein UO65_6169 [Actinokineospora spheciospongiae]